MSPKRSRGCATSRWSASLRRRPKISSTCSATPGDPDPMKRTILAALFALALGSASAQASSYDDSLNAARLGDPRPLVQLLSRGLDPDTVDEQGNTLLIL